MDGPGSFVRTSRRPRRGDAGVGVGVYPWPRGGECPVVQRGREAPWQAAVRGEPHRKASSGLLEGGCPAAESEVAREGGTPAVLLRTVAERSCYFDRSSGCCRGRASSRRRSRPTGNHAQMYPPGPPTSSQACTVPVRKDVYPRRTYICDRFFACSFGRGHAKSITNVPPWPPYILANLHGAGLQGRIPSGGVHPRMKLRPQIKV